MKSFFIVFIIFFLVACTHETKNAPELVLKFSENHFESLLKEGTQKTLIVVLNPSECGSCEAEVTSFVNSIYPEFNSITILPKDIKVSSKIKTSKTMKINRHELDQYGLLNANGSVLIYKGKNCLYFSPIDVININKMKDTILHFKN